MRKGAGLRKQYHLWPGESGVDAWDVDRLVRLTVDLPVERVPLADIREIDFVYWFDDWHRTIVRNVVEHWRLSQRADTTYPVVLGPDGRVLDGMHRIACGLLEQAAIDAVLIAVLPQTTTSDGCPQDLAYDRRDDLQ